MFLAATPPRSFHAASRAIGLANPAFGAFQTNGDIQSEDDSDRFITIGGRIYDMSNDEDYKAWAALGRQRAHEYLQEIEAAEKVKTDKSTNNLRKKDRPTFAGRNPFAQVTFGLSREAAFEQNKTGNPNWTWAHEDAFQALGAAMAQHDQENNPKRCRDSYSYLGHVNYVLRAVKGGKPFEEAVQQEVEKIVAREQKR